MRKINLLWLLLIFIFAFVLRILFLPQNALTFGYDQARDAMHSLQIAQGDLKILGPSSSAPGLYHGVFYYYFLAPAYLIGKGSPIIAAYWVAFFNAATVFVIFYLSFLFTKNAKSSLLAAFIFALSFEATQYATWLSNPTIAIWTVPIAYLGTWLWINKKGKWGPILAGLGLGLSVQAEIFLLYHIVPMAIWLIIARKNINLKDLVKFGASFLISTFTMILVEFKFGFKGIGGIMHLVSSQDINVATKGFGDYLVLYFNQLGKVFANSTYPGNVGYGAGIVFAFLILAIWSARKKKVAWELFIASWLFSHITVVTVGGVSTPFLLVGFAPAIAILLGLSLSKLWEEKKKILSGVILGVIILGNLSAIFKENPRGQTIFAIQKDMLLAKQLAAIDYTYQNSAGQTFSTNTLTSPLWINIVWTYLYKWYGGTKYGYVPTFHGKDQVGQLDSLNKTPEDTKNYFLILEPMGGIPLRYLDETVGEENTKSKLIEEKNWGELKVQKREKLK